MASEDRKLLKQLLDQQKVIDGHLLRLLAILEERPPVAVKKTIQRSARELPMQEAVATITEDIQTTARGGSGKGSGRKAS